MSDPSAGPLTVDSLTAALRAAPELKQAPGLAVAVAQTPQPAANAQAAGLAAQSQAVSTAADQVTQTAGHPPHHHGGLFSALGSVVGAVGHDVTNDIVRPVQRDVLSKHIPGMPTSLFGAHINTTVGGVVGPAVTSAVPAAASLANMPLAQVQHEYRYIHDVWQRHGPVPAVAEMLGMGLVGSVAGAATDSSKVGVLAAEAAGGVEGQLLYHSSWQRTANGNAYRDSSGQLVSPGRDVANLLGVAHSGAAHGVISGGVDALFDLMMDPVANVGGIYGEAKSAGGGILNPLTGNKLFSGTGAVNPGDAEALYAKGETTLGHLDPGAVQFRRGVGYMADHSSSEIAARFPAVTQVPGLADRLGQASTEQGVLNVLEDRLAFEKAVNEGSYTPPALLTSPTDAARAAEAATGVAKPAFTQGLPAESSFRAVTKTAITKLENAPGLGQRFRSLEILPDNLKVSVVGDTGAENLRRLAMQGMPSRVANDLMDEFLATNDIGVRRNIIKAISEATVLGRAGIDANELDAGLAQKVRSAIDEAMGGERPVGEYGIDEQGRNLSPVVVRDPSGQVSATAGAAIWKGQTSDAVGILGYGDVKNLSQEIRGYRSLFGWPGMVDDFAWGHFTNSWRKLALLTGSFAMHITAAEDLLNTARFGFVPMVDGAIKSTVAKMGYDVAAGDAGPIRALVYHLLGSPTAEQFASLAADPAFAGKVDLATHMAIATGGAMVTPEVSADWVFPTSSGSPVETGRTALDAGHVQLNRNEVVGDNYKLYRGDDKNASIWWGQHLNQIAEDPTGQAAAKAYGAALSNGLTKDEASRRALAAVEQEMSTWSPVERQLYMRTTQTSIDGVDPMTAFARTKVESLKGAVTGADGTVHTDLIAKIANGDTLNWRDVQDVTPGSRPWNIPGREILPNPAGRIDRLADIGHRKVLGPVINVFARQPTYFVETSRAYEAYRPLVDSGLIDRGVAMDWAMQDANTKMLKFIHNPKERLQATETMRNVAPFAFAQVQAYKRYGRLLLEDPGAFRRLQLTLTGMTDLANRAKDPGGVQQAVYPGSGYITHGMLGMAAMLGMPVTTAVPVSFAGSTSALQAVDPFMQGTSGLRPSMGPLVSVAAHLIDGFDPRATQVVSAVVGSQTANESVLSLVPNTPVRHLVEAALPPVPGLLRSNDTIWMQTLANLDWAQNRAEAQWSKTQGYKDMTAKGISPDTMAAVPFGRPMIVPPADAPPDRQQQFVDSVRNQGRFTHIVQAVMSEVTPASPQAIIGNKKIPTEFQKLVKAEGLDKAYVDFAAKYPDAGPLIQSMSSVAGGGVLAASKKAMDWVHANQAFVDANKSIASFFVPQASSDTYSAAAYNEQLAMGLRSRKTPQEFQNDFYVNTGWAEYDVNRAAYELALKNAGAQVQYPGDATHPATYVATGQTQLNQAWAQWLATFKVQNPVWAQAYGDPHNTINARQQYNELVGILGSGNAPASPQVAVLKNMVDQYRSYVSQLTPSASGAISQFSSSNAPVTEAWNNWLKATATSDPEYAPVINKIFRWLTPMSPQG